MADNSRFFSKLKIVLGSASPRRKQILAETGFNFVVRTREVDETPDPTLKRGDIATSLSVKKSDALIELMEEDEILVTADTIVCLDHFVLNKPGSEQQAIEMLKMLSGRSHQVYTGVTIRSVMKTLSFATESHVHFNKLSDEMIRDYIAHYKPFDKAGSYGAQECLPEEMNPCSEKEIAFMNETSNESLFERTLAMDGKKHIPIIQKIEGSYFNVMGLPVAELCDRLRIFIK
jgi:septum formation protein